MRKIELSQKEKQWQDLTHINLMAQFDMRIPAVAPNIVFAKTSHAAVLLVQRWEHICSKLACV